MTIQELFIASNLALLTSIKHISDEEWELDMPPGMSRRPTKLGEAVRYHTYDDAWVPDVLDGKTKEEVGDRYEALLASPNILDEYEKYNARANDAVRAFHDLTKVTHLSYGDFPARDYIQHIISFRAFRSYDIAKMIGADTTMDPKLVAALTEEFTSVIEGYRQMGVFPPALPTSQDASPQVKLLAMVGRS
jgi:hypothetical protein